MKSTTSKELGKKAYTSGKQMDPSMDQEFIKMIMINYPDVYKEIEFWVAGFLAAEKNALKRGRQPK